MYKHFDAPSHLKHLVCFFYAMEHHTDDGPLQTLLPSGTPVNGWQYAGRWKLKLNFNTPVNDLLLPDFYMVGQQTISYSLTPEKGLAGIFGAALQPGTLQRIVHKPAYIFTNNPVDTTTLFPESVIRPFVNRYKSLRHNDDRYKLLVDFYTQFNIAETYEVYKEAIQLIYQQKGCVSIKQLCEQLHVNERYLQREFRTHIGIPPSSYLNIIRFNNIFTELGLADQEQNLEKLALYFNYYDVSHFNKTYKKYFGTAPSKRISHRLKLLEELIEDRPYLLQVQYENLS